MTIATFLTMTMGYDSADRLNSQIYPGGEEVVTSYDSAGRAISLCQTSPSYCYVTNANTTYTPLDQPATCQMGNGKTSTWTYNDPLAQLDRMTVPGVFDRNYTYDAVGNVIPGEGGASSAGSIGEIPTTGHVYQKRVRRNDPDIDYVPDGGQPDGRGGVHPPGHVSAVPRQPIPFDDYAGSYE